MGITAENLANEFKISHEIHQDKYAVEFTYKSSKSYSIRTVL